MRIELTYGALYARLNRLTILVTGAARFPFVHPEGRHWGWERSRGEVAVWCGPLAGAVAWGKRVAAE